MAERARTTGSTVRLRVTPTGAADAASTVVPPPPYTGTGPVVAAGSPRATFEDVDARARRVELGLRVGGPGASVQVVGDELVVPRPCRVRPFLGEVADGRGGRGELDDASVGDDLAGQRAQQRRLADTVRTDEPDGVALGDGEVDAVEHHDRAAGDGDAPRAKRGCGWHGSSLPRDDARRLAVSRPRSHSVVSAP